MRVGGDVSAPVEISREPIHLTDLPKQYTLGLCILEAVVTEKGTVTRVRVLRPNPVPQRCQTWVAEAVRAVTLNRYKPATYKGRPVAVYIVFTVHHFPC
jgi:outer membrane biosynthesis protein TonB